MGSSLIPSFLFSLYIFFAYILSKFLWIFAYCLMGTYKRGALGLRSGFVFITCDTGFSVHIVLLDFSYFKPWNQCLRNISQETNFISLRSHISLNVGTHVMCLGLLKFKPSFNLEVDVEITTASIASMIFVVGTNTVLLHQSQVMLQKDVEGSTELIRQIKYNVFLHSLSRPLGHVRVLLILYDLTEMVSSFCEWNDIYITSLKSEVPTNSRLQIRTQLYAAARRWKQKQKQGHSSRQGRTQHP